jgi:hypothetical protein
VTCVTLSIDATFVATVAISSGLAWPDRLSHSPLPVRYLGRHESGTHACTQYHLVQVVHHGRVLSRQTSCRPLIWQREPNIMIIRAGGHDDDGRIRSLA